MHDPLAGGGDAVLVADPPRDEDDGKGGRHGRLTRTQGKGPNLGDWFFWGRSVDLADSVTMFAKAFSAPSTVDLPLALAPYSATPFTHWLPGSPGSFCWITLSGSDLSCALAAKFRVWRVRKQPKFDTENCSSMRLLYRNGAASPSILRGKSAATAQSAL